MSLIVAVAGRDAVAMAGDSLRIDVVTGEATTGYPKVVAHGARLAGIAGISDWNGHHIHDWVASALAAATSLTDVPAAFAAAAGPLLPRVHQAWRAWAGPDAETRDALTVLVAAHEGSTAAVLTLWLDDAGDQLVLRHHLAHAPDAGSALVVAAGSVDDDVVALTADGALMRTAQRLLYRQDVTDPDLPDTCSDAGTLRTWAETVVDAAIVREPALPRPVSWPPDVPVLASPVVAVAR